MRKTRFGVCFLLVLLCGTVQGDILQYYCPMIKSKDPMTMQGRVTVNPGRTVSFRHPRFGTIFFGLENVRYYKVPTTLSIAENNLRGAEGDVEKSIEAARWALHHGMLNGFNKAASQAWRIDSANPTLQRLVKLKREMNVELPESKELRQEMLKIAKATDNMQFLSSKHFLLLHDCPTLATNDYDRKQKSRAEERLELLEQVYESFLLKYCLEGLDLDVPKKRMMVMLFSDRNDYLAFSKSIEVKGEHAAGFYHKLKNISVFYDQSTNKNTAMLIKAANKLQGLKKEAIRGRGHGAKDIVRLVNSLDLLIKVSRENQDIEVVSHETAHQMAANTSLQPNKAAVPTWAAEGLATYFESPEEAAWAGIGVVNKRRLTWYRLLANDTEHSNIDFIVSNQIFMRAASQVTTVAAYGQAWALTHFLMDRHFDKLMEYYQQAAKRDVEGIKKLKGNKIFETYQEDFDAIFGKDKSELTREWRAYMGSLKTDLERVLEENGG